MKKSEFARYVGVTPATVTGLVRKGTIGLADGGKRVDLAHPATIAYLEARAEKMGPTPEPTPEPKPDPAPAKKPAKPNAGPQSTATRGRKRGRKSAAEKAELAADPMTVGVDPYRDLQSLPVDVLELQDMTLREVFNRFGHMRAVLDYADACKKIEDVELKRNKNAKERGELISRDAVKRCFGFVDEAHARMLSDTPARLATMTHSMLDSDPGKEELENLVREGMSKDLKSSKAKVDRGLAKLCREVEDADDG